MQNEFDGQTPRQTRRSVPSQSGSSRQTRPGGASSHRTNTRSTGRRKGGKYARKPERFGGQGLIPLLIAAVLVLSVGVGALYLRSRGESGGNTPVPSTAAAPTTEATEDTTEPVSETTLPEPEHEVLRATVSATGDILMHMPVISSCAQGGGYDFNPIFRYLSEYTTASDYSIANLETTLCGTENGYKYSGYPNFNCPDEVVDGLKDAGFDMLLTANNHSYDTTLVGYKRTLDVVRGKGLATLGTYKSADETKWIVEDVGGIKIGMLCYTYADAVGPKGNPRLNLNAEISESGICNYFLYDRLDEFYTQVEGYLQEMKDAGAEATMMFIHWGVEYQLTQNEKQTAIAQKLCDLGVDVIVGGHPHVVQPIELLTSTENPEHKTVCLYSMGNAVSNQRKGNLSAISTAHTEDGVLFSATFSKYSDGSVYLADVNLMPCWVRMTNSPRQYTILPLDDDTRSQWQTKYDLSDTALTAAEGSYTRTMDIVGAGLTQSREYLAQQTQVRDEAYAAAVYDNAA